MFWSVTTYENGYRQSFPTARLHDTQTVDFPKYAITIKSGNAQDRQQGDYTLSEDVKSSSQYVQSAQWDGQKQPS